MSFLNKFLRSVTTTSHHRLVVLTNKIYTRQVTYNVDSLGMNSFRVYRKYKLDLYDKEFKAALGQKLEKHVNEKKVASIKYNDVFLYLVLAEDQHDLEISLDSFKLVQNEFYPKTRAKFTSNLVKQCYLMNQTDIFGRIYNDQDLRKAFFESYTLFLALNKLYMDKKYTMVIDIFNKYLENEEVKFKTQLFSKYDADSSSNRFGVVRLAMEALLLTNTQEAFIKMKQWIETMKRVYLVMNNTSVAICFLLSINQGDYKFAESLIDHVDVKNVTLLNNLRIICECETHKLETALVHAEEILNITSSSDKFTGTLFPLTFDKLSKSINDHPEILSESVARELIEKLKKRTSKEDLFEYCTGFIGSTTKK